MSAENGEIMVSRDSNFESVAGSIAKALRYSNLSINVASMGMNATFIAVQGMALAGEFLSKDGKTLSFSSYEEEMLVRGKPTGMKRNIFELNVNNISKKKINESQKTQ